MMTRTKICTGCNEPFQTTSRGRTKCNSCSRPKGQYDKPVEKLCRKCKEPYKTTSKRRDLCNKCTGEKRARQREEAITRACSKCGTEFQTKSKKRCLCGKCVYANKQATAATKPKPTGHFNRKCSKCGNLFTSTSGTAAWCNKCSYSNLKKRLQDPAARSARNSTRQKLRNSSITILLAEQINQAKRRNIGYDLDKPFILAMWDAQGGKCALTGTTMTPERTSPFKCSLDRIDSSRGYFRDNVQLVCKWINVVKNTRDNELIKQLWAEGKLPSPDRLTAGRPDSGLVNPEATPTSS